MKIVDNKYFKVDPQGDEVTLRSSTTRVVNADKTVSYLNEPSVIALVNTEQGLEFAGMPAKSGRFNTVEEFDNSTSVIIAHVRFVKQDKKDAK